MEEQPYTVMLIDDNAIDNMIHTKVLERSRLSTVIFNHNSAQSAIECIKNLAKIPDVGKQLMPSYIFLDLDMPLMDGFQFMAELDNLNENIKEGIKVVLLTASQNVNDKEYPTKFKNFHKYLNKPLSIQKIEEL